MCLLECIIKVMTDRIQYPRGSLEPQFKLEDFIIEQAGKGSYGTVFKAVHKVTLKLFAIKQIKKKGNQATIHYQLTTLYKFDFEYIVKLYDHFEDQVSVFLVMEFIEGKQLYESVIKKKQIPNNREIAQIIYQLCLAVNYVHSLNVIHRDIKPQNIMLTKRNKVKLTDFGAAFEEDELRKTTIGTPQYTAPEIVKGRKHSKAVDVWAIGVVLFQLATLKLPFTAKTTLGVYQNIKQGKYQFPQCLNDQQDLKDLISKILVLKPHKRYTCQNIISHPWIQNNLQCKTPKHIKLVNQTPESKDKYIFTLKQKIFKLQTLIRKVQTPERNKQKKLQLDLEMKIAVLQGKIKTINSLTEIKIKRIQAIESQKNEANKEIETIKQIKKEHQEIRLQIQEGNRVYLQHIKQRRMHEEENSKCFTLKVKEYVMQTDRILSSSKTPKVNDNNNKKNQTSAFTSSTSIPSIDLTQSKMSCQSYKGSSQGVDEFFLWLHDRKRGGDLAPKYSQ